MIKAIKGNQLILGLSDLNMERLKQGQPIKFNLKELGLQDMEVLIFNGKTEYVMKDMLKEHISLDTTIIDDNAAKHN